MIDSGMRQTIEGLMKKYPCKETAVLPSLTFIQQQNGHISEIDMEELSVIMNFPEARIFSAASFYSMLKLRPKAAHHIQVCTNVSCSLVNGGFLFDHISSKLNIGEGEITQDGLFGLEAVECVGSCGAAPAIMINLQRYENMDAEKVDEIIDAIRKPEK